MTALPRFMIAAGHKSSGKTVISTGLARLLSRSETALATFKKGPDYIDPMWLAAASGRPCYNLDFHTMTTGEIPAFFASRAGSLSLVEANKGLFDGVAMDGSDSNAALARMLGLPVILVIDTSGMTRGIAPLLQGYAGFDRDVNISGVILNRVGGSRHEGKLRMAVETYTDMPVVGAIGRDDRLELGERHLGLTTPGELAQKENIIDGFARIVADSVDLDAIRAIAGTARDLKRPDTAPPRPARAEPRLRIGIIRDAAFGFYYPDDLEAFQAGNAELVWINALEDTALPAIDGLFIGGGFPECRMAALASNAALRGAIREALQGGLPCYAECGGLMYLCRSLSWQGQEHPMVGLIDGDAVMHARPQGRGYVQFDNRPSHPWGSEGGPVKAHEFHYASIENLPPDTQFCRTVTRGHGIDGQGDGIVTGNTLAGFCHLRNTGPTPWVPGFLNFVARHSNR